MNRGVTRKCNPYFFSAATKRDRSAAFLSTRVHDGFEPIDRRGRARLRCVRHVVRRPLPDRAGRRAGARSRPCAVAALACQATRVQLAWKSDERAGPSQARIARFAVDQLQLPAERIGFVSSNCWDAIGAQAFGFATFWINRANPPVDRHDPAPDRVITTLTELPPLLASSG